MSINSDKGDIDSFDTVLPTPKATDSVDIYNSSLFPKAGSITTNPTHTTSSDGSLPNFQVTADTSSSDDFSAKPASVGIDDFKTEAETLEKEKVRAIRRMQQIRGQLRYLAKYLVKIQNRKLNESETSVLNDIIDNEFILPQNSAEYRIPSIQCLGKLNSASIIDNWAHKAAIVRDELVSLVIKGVGVSKEELDTAFASVDYDDPSLLFPKDFALLKKHADVTAPPSARPEKKVTQHQPAIKLVREAPAEHQRDPQGLRLTLIKKISLAAIVVILTTVGGKNVIDRWAKAKIAKVVPALKNTSEPPASGSALVSETPPAPVENMPNDVAVPVVVSNMPLPPHPNIDYPEVTLIAKTNIEPAVHPKGMFVDQTEPTVHELASEQIASSSFLSEPSSSDGPISSAELSLARRDSEKLIPPSLTENDVAASTTMRLSSQAASAEPSNSTVTEIIDFEPFEMAAATHPKSHSLSSPEPTAKELFTKKIAASESLITDNVAPAGVPESNPSDSNRPVVLLTRQTFSGLDPSSITEGMKSRLAQNFVPHVPFPFSMPEIKSALEMPVVPKATIEEQIAAINMDLEKLIAESKRSDLTFDQQKVVLEKMEEAIARKAALKQK